MGSQGTLLRFFQTLYAPIGSAESADGSAVDVGVHRAHDFVDRDCGVVPVQPVQVDGLDTAALSALVDIVSDVFRRQPREMHGIQSGMATLGADDHIAASIAAQYPGA